MPPWFLPGAFMQVAQPLKGPNWSPDGDPLTIDIVPIGAAPMFPAGGTTLDTTAGSTHIGLAATRGQVTAPGQWRLDRDGDVYKILRVRDFDGFWQFDLAQVQGG